MIQQTTNNKVCDEAIATSMDITNSYEITATIGYVKTIASATANDAELMSLIVYTVKSGATIATLPKEYKGISKELKG